MGSFQTPGVLSPQLLRAVLTGPLRASNAGPIVWSHPSDNVAKGVMPVTPSLPDCEECSLEITLLRQNQSRIRMQYRSNGVSIMRVDVNDRHDGWGRVTHAHHYVSGDGSETDEKLPAFPPVPLGPTVPQGTFRICFEAFAAKANVELVEPYWKDPWKGGA